MEFNEDRKVKYSLFKIKSVCFLVEETNLRYVLCLILYRFKMYLRLCY
jgi:hypothetical protein